MSFPFDANQTVSLLIAGIGALGAYFHVTFQVKQNAKEIRLIWEKAAHHEDKIHELELNHRGHTASLEEVVASLRDAITELRKELTAQREVTLQLERTVARMGAVQHT